FEARTAGHVFKVVVRIRTVTIAHAVVARKIGRSFCRRNHVVGRNRQFGTRQADVDTDGAQTLKRFKRFFNGLRDIAGEPLKEFAWYADAQAFEGSAAIRLLARNGRIKPA